MADELERDIFLCDEINEETAGKIIEGIIKVNVFDTKQGKTIVDYDRNKQPIRLHMTTRGGFLDEAFAIYDQIKCSRTPVWIYVSGMCCSAGFLILGAGHRRIAYENTRLMYHQLSAGGYGKVKDLLENAEELKFMQEKLDKCILDDTDITKDKLKEINEKKMDWYMSSQEALKYGVIDEIITYKNNKK